MEMLGDSVLAIGKCIQIPVAFEFAEFEGGKKNGFSIEQWILEGGGTALWEEAVEGTYTRAGMPEHIRIFRGAGSMFAYVGDYIIKDENGLFKPFRQRNFKAQYEKYMGDHQ
jgi:hypothetical protein